MLYNNFLNTKIISQFWVELEYDALSLYTKYIVKRFFYAASVLASHCLAKLLLHTLSSKHFVGQRYETQIVD